MKISLKPFQTDAVLQLLDEIRWAKTEYMDRGKLQAVVLTSATGSGKTVMATQLIENILFGNEQFIAEPDAVFLWLSDRPQLNAQSRQKMLSCSEMLLQHRLVEVDSFLDLERFSGGKVYFLNTQKLGQEKLLTTKGDSRSWTIWETIETTRKEKPLRFYLILDEAHRGLGGGRSTEGLQPTIVQKFLTGSPGEMDAIPMVLGISATPARFQKLLENDAKRQIRNVTVDPAKVRESGLLKDRVLVFHPDWKRTKTAGAEYSLLGESARELLKIEAAWDKYTAKENLAPVRPALVIQVEDGGSGVTSRTDLGQVLEVLDDVLGYLPENSIAHCFDIDGPLSVAGRKIEKVEASRIQENTQIRVVLFKTSLSTGWDCPRAEVMMSFRKVQDATLIAQLIGRMVRTPLAHRITGDDTLNAVSLFLPYYDEQGLKSVIAYLKQDAESASAIDVDLKDDTQTLQRALWSENAFQALSQVPTYRVVKGASIVPVKRLLRLTFKLQQAGIADNLFFETQESLLEMLNAARIRLEKSDIDFEEKVARADQIPIVGWEFSRGDWHIVEKQNRLVPITETSLELLFNRAAVRLSGSGEALAAKYFKARFLSEDCLNDHIRPKLEFILIADDAGSVSAIENHATSEFNRIYDLYRPSIRKLPDETRLDIEELRSRSKFLEPIDLHLWDSITVPAPDLLRPDVNQIKHLYVQETNNLAPIELTNWEARVVEHMQAKSDFAGWLRNFPRKEWALSIPYRDQGEYKPHFPDLLIARGVQDSILIDILEPHALAHSGDSWSKAIGMADYARKHAFKADSSVGHVEMQEVDLVRDTLFRLDFSDSVVQEEMLQVTSREAFLNLFDRLKNTESLSRIRLLNEHSRVKVKFDMTVDGMVLKAGQRGTIISVYPEHQAYAVEFSGELGASSIATLAHHELTEEGN